MGIAQGATPYLMLLVEGFDMTAADGIMLTLKTQDKTLFFSGERVTTEWDGTEQLVMVHLTQQETLSVSPGTAYTQLRWRDESSESYTQAILPLTIRESIYRGVV